MNDQSGVTRRHLATDAGMGDLDGAVKDAKELSVEAASAMKRTLGAARDSIEDSYHAVKEAAARTRGAVIDQGTVAANATGRYVREYPWVAVGAAATMGLIVGMLIRRR